jgi:hypothetical protein
MTWEAFSASFDFTAIRNHFGLSYLHIGKCATIGHENYTLGF